MKTSLFGLGLLLALGGSGCATLHDVKTPSPLPGRYSATPPIDTKAAYPSWRLIGIKNDADAPCPKIPGWKERQLFQLGVRHSGCGKGDRKGIEAVAKELDRFCIWEGNKDPGAVPPAAALGLTHLEPDAVAMTPAVQVPALSGPFGRRILRPLVTHFADQQGKGKAHPKDGGKANPPVRLAFLDSEPTSEGLLAGIGRLPHGHFLRLVGRDLGGSAVEITTRLALPIEKFDAANPDASSRDPIHGGYVGSFADLAEAIHEEIAAWRNGDQKRGRHLVLNLSVGWDGELFGGLTETRVCDLPVGPRAVYLALELAAREGALIFAAAGNSQLGPHASNGPLLPAAWARGNIRESACGKGLKNPLLYAVGGVQWDGAPITNARRGGMPELAAYADHVAVTDLGGNPTPSYTGTSVATAVVSSIAARIWHEYPHMNAAQIVDRLRASGEDLHYRADFYSGESAPNVRQITYCSALGLRCPERSRPVLATILGEEPSPTDGVRFPGSTPVASATCGGDPFFMVSGGTSSASATLCPSRELDDYWREAWIIPQPEFDPCPDCAMGPPRRLAGSTEDVTLYVEISDKWREAATKDDSSLESGTLEVEQTDRSGVTTHTSYVFDPPDGGKSLSIKLPGGQFQPDASIRATVSWLVSRGTKSYSINSPVLIVD